MNDHSQSDASTAPVLPSKVYDFEQMLAETTPMGERRRIFFAPTATLDQFVLQMSTLAPGQSPHAPHQHPDEEMILIKDGTLEISLNGKLQRVGPGSVVFVAPNDMHGWTNVGETRANYFVLRWWTGKTGKEG
jgi:XRE family transcriptional regulator, regulator of sulfur utilization